MSEEKPKMTTPTQLRRINILIEELIKLRQRAIDRDREIEFNMASWMEPGMSSPNLRSKIDKAVRNPCGTEACLCGKAGLIPRIRRLGFKWDIIPKSYGTSANFQYTGGDGDRYHGSHAVKEFFGEDVTEEVFLGGQDINTLFQGIQALKRFVRVRS